MCCPKALRALDFSSLCAFSSPSAIKKCILANQNSWSERSEKYFLLGGTGVGPLSQIFLWQLCGRPVAGLQDAAVLSKSPAEAAGITHQKNYLRWHIWQHLLISHLKLRNKWICHSPKFWFCSSAITRRALCLLFPVCSIICCHLS